MSTIVCGFQWKGDDHIHECVSDSHGDDEFIAEIHNCGDCGDWIPRQRGEISYSEYKAPTWIDNTDDEELPF